MGVARREGSSRRLAGLGARPSANDAPRRAGSGLTQKLGRGAPAYLGRMGRRTALLPTRTEEVKKQQAKQPSVARQNGDASRIDTEEALPAVKRPIFPPLSGERLLTGKEGTRKIPVPANRYTPLKENWMKIFTPIVEHLGLQISFNLKSRDVEIRTCKDTKDVSSLTKAADFVKTFVLGFQAIERIAGKRGKTKFAMENVTRTRIVLADVKVHILGSFQNIKMARTAICNLILGNPPSNFYSNIRTVASRSADRF
ncbi:hypothetical protein NN561_016584 [Cricetulus griseus]